MRNKSPPLLKSSDDDEYLPGRSHAPCTGLQDTLQDLQLASTSERVVVPPTPASFYKKGKPVNPRKDRISQTSGFEEGKAKDNHNPPRPTSIHGKGKESNAGIGWIGVSGCEAVQAKDYPELPTPKSIYGKGKAATVTKNRASEVTAVRTDNPPELTTPASIYGKGKRTKVSDTQETKPKTTQLSSGMTQRDKICSAVEEANSKSSPNHSPIATSSLTNNLLKQDGCQNNKQQKFSASGSATNSSTTAIKPNNTTAITDNETSAAINTITVKTVGDTDTGRIITIPTTPIASNAITTVQSKSPTWTSNACTNTTGLIAVRTAATTIPASATVSSISTTASASTAPTNPSFATTTVTATSICASTPVTQITPAPSKSLASVSTLSTVGSAKINNHSSSTSASKPKKTRKNWITGRWEEDNTTFAEAWLDENGQYKTNPMLGIEYFFLVDVLNIGIKPRLAQGNMMKMLPSARPAPDAASSTSDHSKSSAEAVLKSSASSTSKDDPTPAKSSPEPEALASSSNKSVFAFLKKLRPSSLKHRKVTPICELHVRPSSASGRLEGH
ncbi:predicted protein [Nematostella vectensis]|uniref:Uncharacterized protein n=1 Tax=Nematostella vectensis TaxID=45351 RepID=A7RVA8_NEMVE|nr:predicted protein [Nematostella vectensis]|eukprot:XP_001636674.1 predicted protein [Nematostella vectensis]